MAKATAQAPAKPGPIAQAKVFLQEVKAEMDKVTWPTRPDLKSMTSVVILFLGILGVIIGMMDFVLQNLVLWLFRIF